MTRTQSAKEGLSSLNDAEKQTVFECLRAACDGPFFPDWEFHRLFGLQRGEVKRIAASIPDVDDLTEDTALAINNALNNLIGYPHSQEAAWPQFISVSREEVIRVFAKWRDDAVI